MIGFIRHMSYGQMVTVNSRISLFNLLFFFHLPSFISPLFPAHLFTLSRRGTNMIHKLIVLTKPSTTLHLSCFGLIELFASWKIYTARRIDGYKNPWPSISREPFTLPVFLVLYQAFIINSLEQLCQNFITLLKFS